MSDTTNVSGSIAAVNEEFMKKFNSGDAAGLAGLYTDSAQFLAPNCEIISGKQGIKALLQGMMNSGIKTIELKTAEIDSGGNKAFEVGKYVLKTEGGQTADQGKYMVSWKLENGKWKMHRDMINTSLPPKE